MVSPNDIPADVRARNQAMALREVSARRLSRCPAPRRCATGRQMLLTHNGKNRTICCTDISKTVTELLPFGGCIRRGADFCPATAFPATPRQSRDDR